MGFILGLLMGALVGLLVAGLCVAAAKADERSVGAPYASGGGSSDTQREFAPDVARDDDDLRHAA